MQIGLRASPACTPQLTSYTTSPITELARLPTYTMVAYRLATPPSHTATDKDSARGKIWAA